MNKPIKKNIAINHKLYIGFLEHHKNKLLRHRYNAPAVYGTCGTFEFMTNGYLQQISDVKVKKLKELLEDIRK